MKFISLLFSVSILLFMCSCRSKPSLEYLKQLSATETYPDDIFLDTVSDKKAMVIVAHDDDNCAMSGTLEKLKAGGWKILQLDFVTHQPATGNELIVEDGLYRLGLDTMQYPYVPITREQMEKEFLREKITHALLDKVNRFQPAVILTLDNEMGGYGHPEHIFISQLVLDLFREQKIHPQKIYQSVFTNHMEREIVDTWLYNRMKKYNYPNPTQIAKNLYQIEGMPDPTVQINISPYAAAKMAYLRGYPESVRKNLRKFIPYYEDFDSKTYFSIFDREFFRVID
ncbi:MAG: hypothetical protein GC171_16825 [Terrimonas sp.]|nr:hypothetical protein [Terrimonas sp.]